ncbi:MAG TPA: choice-of-anchor J domain-containing protein, partial [Bacteroidia bacterium]
MKKFYTLIAAVAVVFTASAQNKVGGSSSAHVTNKNIKLMNSENRAIGDTLMWLPYPGVLLANTADQAAFAIATEDIDGLTTYNAGYDMDWGVYYSTDSSVNGVGNPTSNNWYHPWEVPAPAGSDSSFYWHATSWFNPAGQADNWLMMGPVTLPAGATLKWTDRTNPSYRDGYKVFISTTVSSPMTFVDFGGAAIYTKTDAYPSPTYATDTTWVTRSVGIPAMYSAQTIYIAFQHTANDMDVLYLDEFLVVESTSGVQEFVNGAKLFQNVPNPANGVSSISYQLEKNAQVALNVYDVTGKVVSTQNMGEQNSG